MDTMKKMNSFMICLLPILVILLTTTPGTATAEKPIKLGLIDAYSGAAAAFTKPNLNGWQMAVDEFNEKGGLKGRTIEIITRDSKFKPDEAVSHARELILKENVSFLGGTISSSVALAISEFAKKKKKIFIVSAARSHRISGEKGHKYIFRGCPSADIEGLAGGYYGSTMPFKKWYIIGDDYEYGHSIADNFWKGLSKFKPDVEKIGETWCKLRETDYTPYLTAMMAKKPEAVYAAFGASGLIPFFKQAKLFGLYDKVPVFAFALGDSAMAKALKENMPVGAYAGNNYLWYYPDTPENKAFVTKCKEKYNDPYPSGIGIFGGYCCGKFLTEAIIQADSIDTQKVIKALEGLIIQTAIGPIRMRGCDHQASTPAFWGKVKKVEGYPFPVMEKVTTTPAKKVTPTCKEIAAARKAAKASKK
ncbi:MAG: ABC transporter substrate-binding protein [Desulfatiglans sp.]|jgi:branched-chain amino acid transport system substrate-binding protein|nr:ABC transporter substrate-binding protein [Thermodesulfobacteriota bacterium]MEE4353320.1 ABC transporter substrate-binding protein [Desulfatiglans sp.]